VKYVLLPLAPLEAVDARREAELLRSGRSGLRQVWRGRDGTVYALRHPQPILTGPGHASITRLTSSRIAGTVTRPGSYSLRVHFTPYWRVTSGTICIERARGAMTTLEFARAGPFVLQAVESPVNLIWSIFDSDHRACRRG
jgi:hypothetical protein